MDLYRRSDTGVRTLLIAAALFIVVAGLREAQTLIVPVLASAMIAILFLPAMTWLQSKKVPDGVAVTLVLIGVLGVFALITIGVGRSIAEFNQKLSGYEQSLTTEYGEALSGAKKRLASFGLEWPDGEVTPDPANVPAATDATQPQPGTTMSPMEHFDPGVILRYFGSVAGAAADLLSNTFLIVLTVAFILGEAAGFPRKLVNAFGGKDLAEAGTRSAVESVREYLRIKTETSLATGVLAGVACLALGIDFPILWGFVAFALNFVPNVGSIIAAAPPVLLAFVHGWERAVWIAAVYMVINTVIGNVVEPRLMGRKLGLSSLVVWLSLIFWGWVWGPIGMLFSVPLTMMIKLLLERSDDLRWVAVLLGPVDEEPVPATADIVQAPSEYATLGTEPPPAGDPSTDPPSV